MTTPVPDDSSTFDAIPPVPTEHSGYAQASGDTPAEEYLDDVPAANRSGEHHAHPHLPPQDHQDEAELFTQSTGDTPAEVYLDHEPAADQ
jgi:hypothetical protein